MGHGSPDPEGSAMRATFRVNVTVKIDVAAILLRLGALLLALIA